MTTPQPSKPPKPRKKLGWIVLGVAGLFGLCCVGSFVVTRDDSHPSQPVGKNVAAVGKIGTAVRDGKFEFVVTAVTCGHVEIVNGLLRAQPQGRFCIVDMTVANIGTEPRHFADGNQRAYGPDGNQYAADTGAGVVANGNGQAWWNVINPGNSVAAKVVFDLPPTGTISTLELHDSGFSGGVRVAVNPS